MNNNIQQKARDKRTSSSRLSQASRHRLIGYGARAGGNNCGIAAGRSLRCELSISAAFLTNWMCLRICICDRSTSIFGWRSSCKGISGRHSPICSHMNHLSAFSSSTRSKPTKVQRIHPEAHGSDECVHRGPRPLHRRNRCPGAHRRCPCPLPLMLYADEPRDGGSRSSESPTAGVWWHVPPRAPP
jgi:hypothetical protein